MGLGCGVERSAAAGEGKQVEAAEAVASVASPRREELSAALLAECRKATPSVQELKRLLAAGADVDGSDAEGNSPLAWVATSGKVELVRLLLDAGSKATLREHPISNDPTWPPTRVSVCVCVV